MAQGTFAPPPHVLRQTASESRLGSARSGRSLRSSGQLLTQLNLPGGGRTQGAVLPHPHYRNESSRELALARSGYNERRHGWHDPRGMAESRRLASMDRLPDGMAPPGSWTWTVNKARNHIGAGINGTMDSSDVSSTMVSADSPDWFVGLRTLDGPFNCKAVPVRRCPKNYIEGNVLRVRGRTYEQGECLDITEHLKEDNRELTPKPRRPRLEEPHWIKDFKGFQRDGRAASRPERLKGGGCYVPAEKIYVNELVQRERFDCGNASSAGRRLCETRAIY